MLIDERTKIANILRANTTLQKLFEEFGVDFEQVQNELIKDVLLSADTILQDNTVYALAENPSAVPAIVTLNEDVSTALGLFPAIIATPHEDNYRTYISSQGTIYPYFLKWLYYTYKYYNEEQFFFNNMLEKYIPTYDSEVITSTTHLKVYFDGLGILLDTLDQKVEDLYTLGNIDEVDESYLQHIAQLLGYQKEDFSIQNISFRELIKNLVDIYQTKGTEYSFTLFFKLLGFDAEVREYYWDRDAQNPEQFGTTGITDYLYYLTIQDPRLRTEDQRSDVAQQESIQPISPEDWVLPKDLRGFDDLQGDYSVEEILGFKGSDLPEEDRFTYFKTNFIQFRLTQFYTKQDLTAKDTETILKYVKFLTPIYISSFIEVATTPYEDFFVMENPEAGSVIFGGYPGVPPWVDILLPFIFVTIKDYIPLNLSPAPEEAVVIAQHGWTDELASGDSDSALPIIFGDPDIGISLKGTINLTAAKDLSTNKYVGLKIDQGRGTKLSLQGNTIQTFAQLETRINTLLTSSGLNATASIAGIMPNLDMRISSDALGTESKMFLATGLEDDLFSALSTTPLAPIDGTTGTSGYQDFGLTFASSGTSTGLSISETYNFYVNLDTDDFVEVDASGPIPATSQPLEIVSALNNHYEENVISSFVSVTTPEYIASDFTTSGKILVAYRDTATSNGRLVYMNTSGIIYRSGINFTLYDCRDITVSSSINESVPRNLIAFYDTINGFAKWTVFDNEGLKIIAGTQLEPGASGVGEIVSTTLSNNKVAVAYTTTSPLGATVKTFDLTGPTLVDTLAFFSGGITSLSIEAFEDGLVVGGSTGTGGIIVYINQDLTYALPRIPPGSGTQGASTKTFTSQTPISGISFKETVNDEVFISWRNNDTGTPDYKGYITILDEDGTLVKVVTAITSDDLDIITSSNTINDSIFVAFSKDTDDKGYFMVFAPDGDVYKKERLFYDATLFDELTLNLTSVGTIVTNLALTNRGYFGTWDHLGDIASISLDNKLRFDSLEAGDTWDDTVDNYADTSDDGHRFTMDGDIYESDNFARYHRDLGVDFVNERNQYNTFFNTSPNDDVIPIIEDSIFFILTVLVAPQEFPSDRVDKAGFYIQRNGYISRNAMQEVPGNIQLGYWTRHLDISEDIRTDPYSVRKEINWSQWNKWNTAYEDWSSWTIGIDRLIATAYIPPYIASGGIVISGTYEGGQFFDFVAPDPTGGMVFSGAAITLRWDDYIAPDPTGGIVLSGAADYEEVNFFEAPQPTGSITMSGAATYGYTHTFIYLPSGAIILFGTVDIDALGQVFIPTGADSMVTTGTAIVLVGTEYIASGGANFSGAAVYNWETAHYEYVPAGGMAISGTADTEVEYEYTASGGATLSGAVDIDNIEMIFEVPVQFIYVFWPGDQFAEIHVEYTASGGATISGAADTEPGYEYIGSGGATISGAADTEPGYIYAGSGSATASGAGEYEPGYIYSPAVIPIQIQGAATGIEYSINYVGSGGATMSGSAPAEMHYEYTASGGGITAGAGGYQEVGL